MESSKQSVNTEWYLWEDQLAGRGGAENAMVVTAEMRDHRPRGSALVPSTHIALRTKNTHTFN